MGLARSFVLSGRVQGVGFRPFVYRLAHELRLAGTVRNGAGRVFVIAEGTLDALQAFAERVIAEAPPLARPKLEHFEDAAPTGRSGFEILESAAGDVPAISVPPDLFVCPDCLEELTDPGARRYRYAFINCTQCGPRYTIIESLPYDRPNTAMAGFALCDDCRADYENPLDRRFHAQPLACPACGPHLTFASKGRRVDGDEAALAAAIALLRQGGIVAAKGVGGYHLMCDATSETAVSALRVRKKRPDKPLAVMFPLRGTDGLDAVRAFTAPGPLETAAIASPERPIVLTSKRGGTTLAQGLAPGLGDIGVFLPYAPLHFLLLNDFGGPLVATSGNVSGEPVITDNEMAATRLAGLADGFLHHDRPIVRPADDSVLRVIAGAARPIRVGRGLAPLELTLPKTLAEPLIATGGHMKNAVALGIGDRAIVSPHIGELDSPRARDVFARAVADLQALYGVTAKAIVTDRHPHYWGTQWARRQGLPVVAVGHHDAHASALAGEHPDIDRWLIFAWDGVGLGPDQTLWGGEALLGHPGAWERAASFRPFTLTGGDRAGREPWRSAAGLMWAEGRDYRARADPSGLARAAWARGVNVHRTSAVGRLFDAAAALLLGLETVSFEGQGPMLLEALARRGMTGHALPLAPDEAGLWRTDWGPLVDLLTDQGLSVADRAGIFHASLADALVAQVGRVRQDHAFDAVGLTGGVFQNRLLAELTIEKLAMLDIAAYLPHTSPANDGGLAIGQLIEAAAILERNGQ